jgi:hypothetical protein
MSRDDQPFKTFAYNTDQFIDPHTGETIHDDGSNTYTQPDTGIVYTKNRLGEGSCPFNQSYRIELVPIVVPPPHNRFRYVTEEGIPYVTEDGSRNYVQEIP